MDETKGTKQDNPLAETPAEEKGTTPEKEPETLAEQVAHIKEAAFAEVGRYRVATEAATRAAGSAQRQANAAEERLNKFIKKTEEAELEANRDNPDVLSRIRARQGEREQETELAKLKQELEEEKAKTVEAQEAEAKSTQERNAREIATRLNVDAKTLIKFTDGSTEAMEELAKSLPKKGETTTLTPDSGTTIGGKEITEADILKGKYPSMYK